MTRNIIAATKIDSTGFDNLAVVPVVLENNIDTRVSDTLAQILSINLIKRYAVYPRTSTLEQVQSEYKTQEEAAAEGNQVNIGKGENPRFVLGVRARRLDDENMFNALIINLETGLQYAGGSANYSTLDDGIQAMEELARKLTGAGGTEGGEFDGIRERARASAGRNAASSPSDTTDTTDTADSGGGKRFWGNFGYGALNLALGLGSFVQRDHWGGITCLMGYGMAGVFIAWELSLDYYDDLVGIPGAIGLGVAGVTALYGFIRPAVYNRSRALAAVIDNIHVSVGLGPEHENVVRLSYTLRF
jgi:hypothetical protein